MSRVDLSAAAERDLDEIWRYIAQDSPEMADRFIDRLLATCHDTLAPSPRIGKSREELAPGLRSFPVLPYLLFYRPIEDGIEIARILHGRRDVTALLSSEARDGQHRS